MTMKKHPTAATASRAAEPTKGAQRPEIEKRNDKSPGRVKAELMIEGRASDVYVATLFSSGVAGDIPMIDAYDFLGETTAAVKAGDLAFAEGILVAQAVTLNSMFADLSRRSVGHLGANLPAAETYLRLALKAQYQCRATLETLAVIKSPTTVITRQANINNGGQQQINNGVPMPTASRAGEPTTAPSELLVEKQDGMPMGAPATADLCRSRHNKSPRVRNAR